MEAQRRPIPAAAAFALGALILVPTFWWQPRGTTANVIADVLLAATLTVSVRAFVLFRNRRRYAYEVRQALAPLRAELSSHAVEAEQAVMLAIPPDPFEWAEYLPGGDLWDPVAAKTAGYGPQPRPPRLDPDLNTSPALPAEELLARFDALKSAYAGPDLDDELAAAAAAVQELPETWREFAETYNGIEEPPFHPMIPGLDADPQVVRESEEAWDAALAPLKATARTLQMHRDALQLALRALEQEYNPEALAARDTAAPFPFWVVRTALALAVAAALAWLLTSILTNLGPDITDNVLVGVSGASIGLALAAVASRLGERRVFREAAAPRTQLFQAATLLVDAANTATPPPSTAELHRARNEVRLAVHQLQLIQANPRLDTYGDLVTDVVDAWLNPRVNDAATTPPPSADATTARRLAAAVAQLHELVDAVFAAPTARTFTPPASGK